MTQEQFAIASIREASRFVGLREVKPNATWDNPTTWGDDKALAVELRAMMRPSPWEPGWAYCITFCEGVYATTLSKAGLSPERLRAVMSPSVLSSYRAFDSLKMVKDYPVPGALWLAQHGNSGNGHAGIVTAVEGARLTMATIEANTSMDSSNSAKDREGDWITTRVFPRKGRGTLRTLGFVHPDDLLGLSL